MLLFDVPSNPFRRLTALGAEPPRLSPAAPRVAGETGGSREFRSGGSHGEVASGDGRLRCAVGRACRRGRPREREQAEAYGRRNLAAPAETASAADQPGGGVGDGGRQQERAVGPNVGVGVKAPAWRESKVAVLQRMTGEAPQSDPHPVVPLCFQVERGSIDGTRSPLVNEASKPIQAWPLEPLAKTSLAPLDDSRTFG